MKRFYRAVTTACQGDGWQVLLDGRPVRTPLGQAQIVPNEALATALAQEWAAQGEVIDPGAFPLRDLADYALDHALPNRDGALATILRFAETDTLCYRADPDEPLYHRQQELWEPLLSALEEQHGLRFERVCGIVHRPQPPATLERLRALLDGQNGFTLSAMVSLASLAASCAIALAALADDADAQHLWSAANLEEDWQADLWGQDPVAADRRAKRLGEFSRALHFARLALSG